MPIKQIILLFLLFFLFPFGSIAAEQNKLQRIESKCSFIDEDKTIRCLKMESEKDPQNEHIWFKLGWYMQKRSLNKKAIFYYEKCLQVNSRYTGAYINLGNIYMSQNNKKKAQEYYDKALKSTSDSPDVHYNIGVLYLKQNDLNKARHHFLAAIEKKPDDAQAHLNAGVVYVRLYQQNHEKKLLKFAKAHFLKAIELKKDYANAYYNLALLYEKENSTGLAIRYYKEAARYYPDYSFFKRKALNKIQYLEKTRY